MRIEVKKSRTIKSLIFVCILMVLSTALWGCGGTKKLSKDELKVLCESAMENEELYFKCTYDLDGEEGTLAITRKKENYRVEIEAANQLKTTLIVKDNYMYGLDTEEKTAVKLSMGSQELPMFNIYDYFDDVNWDTIDYTGIEKFNGTDCHVVLEKNGNSETKTWFDAKTGFPLKFESKGDNSGYIEVSEFKIGSVSDTSFDIPDDYEIIDFEELLDFSNM